MTPCPLCELHPVDDGKPCAYCAGDERRRAIEIATWIDIAIGAVLLVVFLRIVL